MTKRTSSGEPLTFPAGFTWGAATAAYQIEGAPDADGKGPSIWDTFSHTPGKVRGGDTGDIACDSYRRYREDADLISSLGLTAYRFSISWPRVFPDGAGKVNQAGLDHYRALLDALGERGIAAAATLFHWDLPQGLQDRGGWAARETALRFADYAGVVGEALGDRVTRWITINEPLVVSHNGYRIGVHAPGLCDDVAAAAATHHLLLGHGLAAAALRTVIPPSAEVGITLNLTPVLVAPAADGAATALEQARLITDATANGIFLEPLLAGRYPAHAPAHILPPAELIAAGDMEMIAAPLDFLGVNYYQPVHLRPGDPDHPGRDEEPPQPGIRGVVAYRPEGMELTAMGWLIDPDGLYELLARLAKDAPDLPLFITENGCAAEDYVTPEGVVYDIERIKYLHLHLDAMARAARDGANLSGYFVWSLLDNFEWAYGYQKRFGIVFVDFGTQRRIPKASSAFYADVARANAVPPLPREWPALRDKPDTVRYKGTGPTRGWRVRPVRRDPPAGLRQQEKMSGPRRPPPSAATQDPLQCSSDLSGQFGAGRAALRRKIWRVRMRRVPAGRVGVPDQPAVQALDLVQPLDQVRAVAAPAARQVGKRGRNAGRADEHLAFANDTAAPRTALPGFGVCLPRAAPVTRHLVPSRYIPSPRAWLFFLVQPALRECRERLLVVGDVARLRDGVDHLPAHDAFFVDDERAPGRDAPVLIENAVGLGDRSVRPEVREQRELEALRVGPGAVGEEGVHRHREQFHVVTGDLGELVAHPAQLGAAHRAEGQRVEHQHHVLGTAEAGQLHGGAVLVGKLEVGGLVPDLNCHADPLKKLWSWNNRAKACYE